MRAIFRAQEMCYFWIVNALELQIIAQKLEQELSNVIVLPISLSMEASIAYWDERSGLLRKPKMDVEQGKAYEIVTPIFVSGSPEHICALIEWFQDKARFRPEISLDGLDNLVEQSKKVYEVIKLSGETSPDTKKRARKLFRLISDTRGKFAEIANEAKNLTPNIDEHYIEDEQSKAVEPLIEFLNTLRTKAKS